MANRHRFYWIICAVVGFSCAVSHGERPRQFDRESQGHQNEVLLARLISPKESVRFQVLEAVRERSQRFSLKEVERALTQVGEKNVSSLIFIFMETQNDILYRLEPPAKRVLENTQGSFPNIAYYYARVCSSQGLKALFALYETHEDSKMAICKAIGETGNPKGAAFLLKETERMQPPGSRIPMLAGLTVFRLTLDKSRIASLLKAELDREEIILLSELKTNFTAKELVSLYKGSSRECAYALEYIFRAPEDHFEALRFIINEMLSQKQFDRARELMMSDRIRRSSDERVRKLRESVLERVSFETS